MNLSEIENDILKLGMKDRASLAKWLLQSLEGLSEVELQNLWMEEAERRLDEMEQGLTAEIPAEEFFRRVRNAVT
jgi:putative addiction module component (TIGR02574 family)